MMLFDAHATALPPLPPQDSAPRESIFPFLGDHHLPYIAPALTYWIISLAFHYIDEKGYFKTYKLHTPAELLKKNRASQWQVIKFALLQQLAQFIYGYITADPTVVCPSEAYSVALWARRVRWLEVLTVRALQAAGLFTILSAKQLSVVAPAIAVPPLSGPVANFLSNESSIVYPGFGGSMLPYSSNEILAARIIYWYAYPTVQYILAMALADSWQYFTHRVFHANKWLYKHIHSLHHDVYVPFAYGAFYNHPLETIPVDVLGFPVCLELAGLDNRQAAFFGCLWTYKTVVDHCGYDLPWNPSNIICPNSVVFHDLHHQSWGLKYNFSNYSSFWDMVLGTYWAGHDPKALERFAKGRVVEEPPAADANAVRKLPDTDQAASSAVEL